MSLIRWLQRLGGGGQGTSSKVPWFRLQHGRFNPFTLLTECGPTVAGNILRKQGRMDKTSAQIRELHTVKRTFWTIWDIRDFVLLSGGKIASQQFSMQAVAAQANTHLFVFRITGFHFIMVAAEGTSATVYDTNKGIYTEKLATVLTWVNYNHYLSIPK